MANKLPPATAGMTFPRPKPDTPPSKGLHMRAVVWALGNLFDCS